MTRLKDMPALMIDCQTTGMRPPAGQILELAWTIARASDSAAPIQSHLLALATGAEIPFRVSELTGITNADLNEAKDHLHVLEELRRSIAPLPRPAFAVIHYAQFEKPFLTDLFARGGTHDLPFEIFCSHAITKRLFPNLPSQNIRGTAGFFGDPVGALKRSSSHVTATFNIWRGLVARLEEEGILNTEQLQSWLAVKKKRQRRAVINTAFRPQLAWPCPRAPAYTA